MPLLNPKYYTDGDKDILSRMSDAFVTNSVTHETFCREATTDVRFKAGDQYLWNDIYSRYPAYQKKRFNYNRLRRIISMVSGHQRRSRKSTIILPQHKDDEETAEQMTKIIDWCYNSNKAYHTISEAFEGAITTGLAMLSLWMDYSSDPINGDLKIENLGYNQVIFDQYFRKPDMSDASFLWTRKFMTSERAAALLPERNDDIKGWLGGFRDNKFNWMPEAINRRSVKLVPYDEFWYQDYRTAKFLIDKQSGETTEWVSGDESLKDFMREHEGRIVVHKSEVPTVKLAVSIGDRIFYNGPNPYGSKYPFVPVMCYFEPDIPFLEWKITGMIRQLRDAQFIYNRMITTNMLDVIESQINSGLKVMEDSLVDDNDAFMTGQGRVLFIKKDAPQGMQSIEHIPPPGINPSVYQLSQSMANEITQISGVNEELLGSADDDKAGVLSMLRQGAGLTTLQGIFDSLDRAQILLGEISVDAIQENFTYGKVRRILNAEPTERFFDKSFQKFDCMVAEGALSDTQRKASFVALLEMQKLGIAIPPDLLIDKAPIAEKKDLIDAIRKQQEQQAKQAEQTQQLQMQQLAAEIELMKAKSAADQGLAIERASRVNENESLSVERRSKAVLDEVKAAKELQGMDIEHLNQLISILTTIKGQQDVETEKLNPVKEGQGAGQQPQQPQQPNM